MMKLKLFWIGIKYTFLCFYVSILTEWKDWLLVKIEINWSILEKLTDEICKLDKERKRKK